MTKDGQGLKFVKTTNNHALQGTHVPSKYEVLFFIGLYWTILKSFMSQMKSKVAFNYYQHELTAAQKGSY